MNDTISEASDSEWQRATTSDKEWQPGVILVNFSFFRIREEPITKPPKEDPFNQRLWGGPVDLRADLGKQAPKKNVNNKKQLWRPFFLFVIHTTLKIYKDSMI